MSRTVLPFLAPADWRSAAPAAAAHLRAGGLLAHPTETVYGFGCALRRDALERLADLKDRRGPFLVLVAGAEDVENAEWSDDAVRIARGFWPGPVTLILRTVPGAYPEALLGKGGTLAVRATSHPGMRVVLRELGEPVTSTSANERGAPPAATAAAVRALLDRVDPAESVWVLDGGALAPSPPSTLVDCTAQPPRVLRAGATSTAALRTVVDGLEEG